MKLILKDFRPPTWNSFYAGKHWSVRQKKAKEIQDYICAEIKNHKFEPIELNGKKARFIFGCYLKGKGIDADNICVKPIIDGFKLAGIIEDDKPAIIEAIEVASFAKCMRDELVIDLCVF